MKFVPIFFLTGFSILHLIYVIAVPSTRRYEVEKLEDRKAAAVRRFLKSKRNAPFRSPWKRRHVLAVRLANYTKYLKAISKKFLRSAKSRLETQIAVLRGSFLRVVGRDIANLHSYQSSQRKYWRKQSTALKTGVNERSALAIPIFKPTSRKKLEHSGWSAIHVTAAAYNIFKQAIQEALLRIQTFVASSNENNVVTPLTAPDFQIGVKDSKSIAKRIETDVGHISATKPLQEILRKKAKADELLSRTYVPVPSEAPSLEPTPGTSPEPSIGESVSQTYGIYNLESSETPKLSDLSFGSGETLPASAVSFRRLARFAARI